MRDKWLAHDQGLKHMCNTVDNARVRAAVAVLGQDHASTHCSYLRALQRSELCAKSAGSIVLTSVSTKCHLSNSFVAYIDGQLVCIEESSGHVVLLTAIPTDAEVVVRPSIVEVPRRLGLKGSPVWFQLAESESPVWHSREPHCDIGGRSGCSTSHLWELVPAACEVPVSLF